MKTVFNAIFFGVIVLVVAACGQEFQTRSAHLSSAVGVDETQGLPVHSDPAPQEVSKSPIDAKCSQLDFTGVDWPTQFSEIDNKKFAISLNISSSFEGGEDWKNLTGNFDGQGISLGLLQQNLGQGSLQPLLIDLFQNKKAVPKKYFNSNQLSAVTSMLETWGGIDIQASGEISLSSIDSTGRTYDYSELFEDTGALNALDEGYSEPFLIQAQTRNGKSVTWAQTFVLDKKGNVTPTWKASFQGMAMSSEYRSIQMKSAIPVYTKAYDYFKSFEFKELRGLFLMFDFVVQNGGFTLTHANQFKSWKKANPKATEEAKMRALLDIRLKSVRTQYREDVKSRKTTVILGTGIVHGERRNLPKEFCYVPTAPNK